MPVMESLPGSGFGETIARSNPAATGAWSKVFGITDSRQQVEITNVIINITATATAGNATVGLVGITTTTGTDPTNSEVIAKFTTSDLQDRNWFSFEFGNGLWLTATSHSIWVRGDNVGAASSIGFMITGVKYDSPV